MRFAAGNVGDVRALRASTPHLFVREYYRLAPTLVAQLNGAVIRYSLFVENKRKPLICPIKPGEYK
jgi:hypothetical protein